VANDTDYKKALESLGFVLEKSSGNQLISDCPFCEKEDKFYINEVTGLFDCKVCGVSGNFTTLLRTIYESCPDPIEDKAHNRALMDLAFRRNFTVEQLAKYGFRKWTTAGKWLLPIENKEGHIVNFRVLESPKFETWSVKGIPLVLGFLPRLNKSNTVWLCEGEWDGIALLELIEDAKVDATVICVPGSQTFKKEWISLFKGKQVIIAYDNDSPGQKGIVKVTKMLAGVADSMYVIDWKETDADGKDVRDLVQKDALEYAEIASNLIEVSAEDIGDEAPFTQKEDYQENFPHWSDVTNRDFSNCVDEVSKYLLWDSEMELGLKFLCAQNISLNFKTDAPLWGFLTGPSSSGKTALVMAFDGLINSRVESDVSPKGWVSGFSLPGSKDPSLIKQFLGKAVYFKDWTVHITKSTDDRKEVDGILRDAYEGKIDRGFGNGVQRHYRGTFTLSGGVTSKIYAEMSTDLGERTIFCPFYRGFSSSDPAFIALEKHKSEKAFTNKKDFTGVNLGIRDAVEKLCCVRIDYSEVPEIPRHYFDALISLAQITARLRVTSDRDRYTDNLKYTPEQELSGRLNTQFCLLFQAFGCLREDLTPTEEDFFDVARIAIGCCKPFSFEIIKFLLEHGAVPKKDLTEELRLRSENLDRLLDDLRMIDVIVREKEEIDDDEDKKFAQFLFSLHPSFIGLCEQACITEVLEHENQRLDDLKLLMEAITEEKRRVNA
jgi:hypothetical protein